MIISLLCQLGTKIPWECVVWTVLSRARARIGLSWLLFNALFPQVFKGVVVVGTMPKHWSCFFLELYWITSGFSYLSCPGLDPGDINRIGPRFALRELVGWLEGDGNNYGKVYSMERNTHHYISSKHSETVGEGGIKVTLEFRFEGWELLFCFIPGWEGFVSRGLWKY